MFRMGLVCVCPGPSVGFPVLVEHDVPRHRKKYSSRSKWAICITEELAVKGRAARENSEQAHSSLTLLLYTVSFCYFNKASAVRQNPYVLGIQNVRFHSKALGCFCL